jgi:hypothetical protein
MSRPLLERLIAGAIAVVPIPPHPKMPQPMRAMGGRIAFSPASDNPSRTTAISRRGC